MREQEENKVIENAPEEERELTELDYLEEFYIVMI